MLKVFLGLAIAIIISIFIVMFIALALIIEESNLEKKDNRKGKNGKKISK